MSAARFLLGVMTAVLSLIAVFCAVAAAVAGPAAGVAAAVLAVAAALCHLVWLIQGHAYVETTGVVRQVLPVEWSLHYDARVTVHCAEPEMVLETGMTQNERMPRVGDRVRVIVPIEWPGRAGVITDDTFPPLAGVTVFTGSQSWLGLGWWDRFARSRRIPLRRWHWLAGRPVWQTTSAERLRDIAAELISEFVLGWHRRRCLPIADAQEETPEFLTLSKVFRLSWHAVVRRALREQGEIFDATEASRMAAFRAAVPLPFVAILLALTAVVLLPDLAMAGAAVLASLFNGSLAPLLGWVRAWRASAEAVGIARYDLYVTLSALLVVQVAVLREAVRSIRHWAQANRAWRLDLARVIQDRLRAEYQRAANAERPVELNIRSAPGFATLSADRMVPRRESAQLRGLAFDLGAGAVAVSGPRGVGKTTLLSAVAQDLDAGALGVVVSAPVRYEPREFLLHLYSRLCRTVLDRLGDQRARSGYRRAAARLRRAAAWSLRTAGALCLATVLFAGTQQWLVDRLPLPEQPGTWLAVSAALFALDRLVRVPEPARELELAAEAAKRLRQTRFLQTVGSEQSAGLGHAGALTGWRRSRQWAEQPHSLPELVAGYRTFATAVADWWRGETGGRGKLIIAIDEADRIADPLLAEQFVNEIKATFGVAGCVFLVSLSDEALAGFERRVVRLRTVFDSAFDHVVRLRPLTLYESVDLLRHRVTGVPDAFWALCHCLAGGMPRDVLRMARTMLDEHRGSIGPTSLPAMAERLVALEVEAVRRAFQQQDVTDPELRRLLADPSWPDWGAGLDSAIGPDLAGASAAALAVDAVLRYNAAVLDLFTAAPDVLHRWQERLADQDHPRAEDDDLVAALTTAHHLLTFDPEAAALRLGALRATLAAGSFTA